MEIENLYRRISLLTKEERKQLAFRILDSITEEEMDHQDRYDMLVSKAEYATGHELTMSKCRNNTIIRRFVADRLFKDGYGWTEIGRLMGRHHASVISMYRAMQDMKSLPSVYKKELLQYKMFNELVEEFDNG